MKVLHAAALLKPPIGVVNQMEWEYIAAKNLGIHWDVKMFCPAGSAKKSPILIEDSKIDFNKLKLKYYNVYAWNKLRIRFYKWVSSIEDKYDIILLRYYVHDPYQYLFVKKTKKTVLFIHHTLEVPELLLKCGVVGFIRGYAEKVGGYFTLKYANGIICVTNEILRYEKSRVKKKNLLEFLYPNGILYDNEVLEDQRKEIPEIIFVASNFAPWHGLDLLLKSIKTNKDKFILNIVGNLSEEYKNIIKNDKRIIYHGLKEPQDVKKIISKCWVGLSSFALHRKKMKEACTLKVREYLKSGLPVYAGYKDVFDEHFEYYRHGPADIDQILRFAYLHRSTPREKIAKASKIYIDKTLLLKKLYNKLKNTYL